MVRAYSKAAKLALDAAGVNIMREWHVVLISCSYALYERVKAYTESSGACIEATEFGEDIVFEVLVPVPIIDAFSTSLRDMSAGSIEPVVMDTVFRGACVR